MYVFVIGLLALYGKVNELSNNCLSKYEEDFSQPSEVLFNEKMTKLCYFSIMLMTTLLHLFHSSHCASSQRTSLYAI